MPLFGFGNEEKTPFKTPQEVIRKARCCKASLSSKDFFDQNRQAISELGLGTRAETAITKITTAAKDTAPTPQHCSENLMYGFAVSSVTPGLERPNARRPNKAVETCQMPPVRIRLYLYQP